MKFRIGQAESSEDKLLLHVTVGFKLLSSRNGKHRIVDTDGRRRIKYSHSMNKPSVKQITAVMKHRVFRDTIV